MEHILGKKFNFISLMRFAAPSMLMMLVTSLYTIVDSIFVSRFVGTNALSAINIVYPVLNIVMAFGIMLASGGSAIIARELGSDKPQSAREHLTLIVITGILIGAIVAILGLCFLHPLLRMLGATDILYKYCADYLIILLIFAPFNMLQLMFQSFFVTAGKPTLGMLLSLAAGLVNVLFDYIFIVVLHWGVAGAAAGTVLGYMIPSIIGIAVFCKKGNGLHFGKLHFDFRALLEACSNGSSEMVTNLAMGLTTFIFNMAMLRLAGEDGVAAVTIVLYAQFVIGALLIGFSMGVAPIISYNHGSQNNKQLKSVFRYCTVFIAIASVISFFAALYLSPLIIGVFTPEGSNVYKLAIHGFPIFSISFLFAGFNIFASSLFTALSNGKISAIISFLRTFLFTAAFLIMLPILFGIDGVWFATSLAEAAALIVSIIITVRQRKIYHYL
ncbi:MAG: MATE family efflux transporter [Oscillospiraceae bacterium]